MEPTTSVGNLISINDVADRLENSRIRQVFSDKDMRTRLAL